MRFLPLDGEPFHLLFSPECRPDGGTTNEGRATTVSAETGDEREGPGRWLAGGRGLVARSTCRVLFLMLRDWTGTGGRQRARFVGLSNTARLWMASFSIQ